MSIAIAKEPNLTAENEQYLKSLRLVARARDAFEYERYTRDAIDSLRHVFDDLTGDACCVTIKMANPDGTVYTYLRDRLSPVGRHHADVALRKYSAQTNSAFRLLMDSVRCLPYFLCNDLTQECRYENCNPNWPEYYNASLVAPIREPMASTERWHDVLGFLCVDNISGGFDDVNAKALVAFAYEMYFAISASNRIMNLDAWDDLSLK